MLDEDKPVCVAVEKELQTQGSLSAPFSCEIPIQNGQQLLRPGWENIPKAQLLPLAKRLETLVEMTSSRPAPWTESEQFIADARKRIDAGDLTISVANVPAGPDGNVIFIVRYQRFACTSEATKRIATRVEFFRAESAALNSLVHLRGLGSPSNLFIFQKKAYFESESTRDFDDSFKRKLDPPQALIWVHRMVDDRFHVRICRLLYEEKRLTNHSTGPARNAAQGR